MADILLTDNSFKEEVLNAELPVLVDFWASWCGPCKAIGPIVEELAEEYNGKLKVGKLNVDENQQIAGQFNIMSIPTLAFFKNGKVVKTLVGVQGKDSLKKTIEEILIST